MKRNTRKREEKPAQRKVASPITTWLSGDFPEHFTCCATSPPKSASIQSPAAYSVTLVSLPTLCPRFMCLSVSSLACPVPDAAVLGLGQRPRHKVESQVLLVGVDRDVQFRHRETCTRHTHTCPQACPRSVRLWPFPRLCPLLGSPSVLLCPSLQSAIPQKPSVVLRTPLPASQGVRGYLLEHCPVSEPPVSCWEWQCSGCVDGTPRSRRADGALKRAAAAHGWQQ